MEKDPKVKVREPEEGKAAVSLEKVARGPAQIPAQDQEKDRAEDGAEVEASVKAEIKEVPKENKISKINERKIIF